MNTTNRLKVAILGAGPTAFFAACAARDCGHIPEIFGFTMGDPPAGSFYLHDIPPWIKLAVESQKLATMRVGVEENYIQKQYGKYANGITNSSFPKVAPKVPLITTIYPYSEQIKRYLIENTPIQLGILFNDDLIMEYAESYDVVLHTFPTEESILSSLGNLYFPVSTLHIPARNRPNSWWRKFADAVNLERLDLLGPLGIATLNTDTWFPNLPNLVLYDGTLTHPYVRLSVLFQHLHLEFPVGYHEEKSDVLYDLERIGFKTAIQPTLKPQQKRWDGYLSENVFAIGRYATWDTQVLSHQAYYDTCGILKTYTTEG